MGKYICKVLPAEIVNEDKCDQGVTLTGTTLPLSAELIRKILGKD